jgi:hypothetical protein
MSLPQVYTLQITANDTTLIASSQTNAAGQPLVFNTPNTDYIMPGGIARRITVGSTANISSANFAIFGLDSLGQQVTENITGVNNNSVSSNTTYSVVQAIINNNGVGPVFAGLGIACQTNPIQLDYNRINGQYGSVQFEVSGGTSPNFATFGRIYPWIQMRPGNVGNANGSAMRVNSPISNNAIAGLTGNASLVGNLDRYYSQLYITMSFADSTPGIIRATVLQPGLV